MRDRSSLMRIIEAAGLDRIERARLAGMILNDVEPDTPSCEAFARELDAADLGELVTQLTDIEANR